MITYQAILTSAAEMICEDAASPTCSDYTERARYLLPTVCSECLSLDRQYRKANGEEVTEIAIPCVIDLTSSFPLSDTFLPAVTYYLAAMLVLEENEDLSDKLFSLYTDAISSIQASLPAVSEKIRNRYPAL